MVSVYFTRSRGALQLEIVNSLRVVFDTNEICYILLLLIDEMIIRFSFLSLSLSPFFYEDEIVFHFSLCNIFIVMGTLDV